MGRFSFCCPFSDGNKDSNRAIPQNRYTYGLLALCGYVEYVLLSGKGFLTLSLLTCALWCQCLLLEAKKTCKCFDYRCSKHLFSGDSRSIISCDGALASDSGDKHQEQVPLSASNGSDEV